MRSELVQPHPHILLVEDEVNLRSTLHERLDHEGYRVTAVGSASEAYRALTHGAAHLALLDVSLPDGTGLDIARFIQEKCRQVAIIFLTAFGSPEDRLRGLELGAEDYVVKPFTFQELLLRIKNVLKRSQDLSNSSSFPHSGQFSDHTGADAGVEVGRARVSFHQFQAQVDGKIYPLSQRETALLKLLVENRGKILSRDEVLDRVWSPTDYPTSRTIDNFIVRLRRIVEENPEHPQVIRSIRGVGYLLT